MQNFKFVVHTNIFLVLVRDNTLRATNDLKKQKAALGFRKVRVTVYFYFNTAWCGKIYNLQIGGLYNNRVLVLII